MNKRLISVSNLLANVCGSISEWFDAMSCRLSRCPVCGGNPYYGKPCVSLDPVECGESDEQAETV